MYKYRKIISIVAAMLILFGTLAFGGISRAKAIEPGLYEVEGNPTCSSLYTLHPDLYDLGPLFGIKYDGNPMGDLEHTLTNEGEWVLETGTPSDSINWVKIFNVMLNNGEGYMFDWAASLGIDAVIVKAKDANAFVYYPEEYGDDGLYAPEYKAISHISFCYDYELTATKTANAEFTRTYEWEITKDYDGTYNLLAGGSVDHDYLVTVDKTGYTDSDFKVTGTITITNNTPFDDVAYTVTDKVGIIDAVVTCPQPQELDSGDFAVCTYTADLPGKADGTNTATISTTHGFVGGEIATADYIFGDPTTEVYATINVTDTNVLGGLGSASGYTEWEYSKEFTCSTDPDDYIDGFYTYDHTNTATIDETVQSDDATVTVNCYAPVVTKTADEFFTRYWDWEIVKEWDGDYDKFLGESVDHNYKVSVTPTSTDNDWQVKGTINVTNSHPTLPMVLTSVSDLAGGITAEVTCPSLTVPAAGTLECTYETLEQDSPDANPFGPTNTATAVFVGSNWTGAAPIMFPTVPTSEVGKEITVDDDNLDDENWSANGVYAEWTYSKTFTCSSDPDLYIGGKYTITHTNTATINETGADDIATVTVDCYAPVLTKDANASYDERHTWDIEKSVDPLSQSGYPGDLLDWTWMVTVTEDYIEENFAVSGSINVANPAGSPGNMTVSLVDQLNDGTFATVDCGEGATSVTVAPGAIETCSYTAGPSGRTATLNTATGTFNTVNFVATAPVSFVKTVINGTAVVDDDMETAFPLTLTAGEGPWYWTEPGSHTCSSDATMYAGDGTYDGSVYNLATITGSNGQYDEASAETYYLCEAGFVDLLKLTDGLVDPTKNWSFALYLGPDGFGGTQVGTTSSTLDDMDGVLEFGNPALSPDKTYTICELGIAAGWSSKWWLMPDIGLVPYNPDEDSVPPEDLGNRCVDFGAGTVIPITVGETVHFKVDNSYPGGDPRTPGYWKNWNRCTVGGQQFTADANGGWEEGFWLLEDVLDTTIGGGISWADITIDNCDDAVMILDKRTLDGKKVASDPLHNLATHLLAAQLNFGAGACTTPEVLAKALEAETLLDKYNFDGYGHDSLPKKSPDGTIANSLATYLDQYNNGMYCGSLMP
ncbi:MAG: hypothetical protein K0B14_14825 [Anaerolineaceae bacterium]|nr:hypothetical protein [Anaerolineaceae bacterium]